jgi:hypothetical protein
MRRQAAIALICLSACGLPAQETQLHFDSTRYNFGKVPVGTTIRHDFTFTNVGPKTLEISSVEPSCSCLTVEDWSRKVEAGQSGHIRAKLDTSHIGTGLLLRAVTFASNTAEQEQMVLLFGEVWNEMDVDTNVLSLFVKAGHTNASAGLSLSNHLDKAVEVLQVTSDNPALSVSLRTNQPGKSYKIEVAAVMPLEVHEASGHIGILTSSTNQPMITIGAFITRDQ